MKILLSNASYVGDTILATSVLPVLKSAFPECKIGFLASPWSKEVVEDHRFIDWLHIYNHPKLNYAPLPKRLKRKEAMKSWNKSLSEIREVGYDIAFELYSYFKNHAGHLLYQANIPRRVAYCQARSPFFFNDFAYFEWLSFHMVENHGKMLHDFGVEKCHLEKLWPCLDYKKPLVDSKWAEKLPATYILIHAGTKEPIKEWSVEAWRELLLLLEPLGYPVVFIGKGKKEKSKSDAIREGMKNTIDLVDKLTLRETMEVVKRAKLVVGMDSMVAHLTSAFRVPGVFIHSGFFLIGLWRPYADTSEIIYPKGFDPKTERATIGMIHTITAKEVFEKVVKQLEKYENGVPAAPPVDLTLFDRFLK